MAYQSLYRKYRPQTFADLLGQEHVARTLAKAVAEDRVAHAYLFTGPRGTGKTSTARILAKALNCENRDGAEPCGRCNSCIAIAEAASMDVIEMDAASHSKVEETREILTGVALATAGGRKKVYVIDEVHMLTTQSFNALLKTLEEPPQHVVFVLATTEAHKVLPTIVSRTQRFDFRRLTVDVTETHLADVAKRESINIDPDALTLIARHADGSMRDALAALEQLATMGTHISIDDVERMLGGHAEDAFYEVFAGISGGDVGAIFSTLHKLVADGADVRQLAQGVLGHARSLLLVKTSPGSEALLDVAEEHRHRLNEQAQELSVATLTRVLDLVSTAATDMRNAPNHRLLLEVALVRCAAPETDPSPTGLLGRIERLERRVGIQEGVAADSPAPGRRQPVSGNAPPTRSSASRTPPRPKAQKRPSDEATASAGAAAATTRPPDEARAATPAGAAAPAAGHVGLAAVRDAWSATMHEVNSISKRVGAYLNPSQPLRFDGESLVIEVRSPFHAEAMSQPANRDKLEDALHAALGIRPPLVFVGQGSDAAALPQQSVEEVVDYSEETSEAEVPDPIELVKKGLGAEIVEEINEG